MQRVVVMGGLFVLSACHMPVMADKACTMEHVPVVAADSARRDVYIGKSSTVLIKFHNENAPKAADVFPDSSVRVERVGAGASSACEIKEGQGIWSGKKVYLERRAQVLLLNEYSGASDSLSFFSTQTCAKLDELDVSGRRWEVLPDRIRLGRHCRDDTVASCQEIQDIKLTARCLPDAAKK